MWRSRQGKTQTGSASAYLHINMERVDELEQGLVRLLPIKTRQYCTQVQRGRLKGCLQHETGRCAGDQGTLIVVGNLDGNGLLILRSMAGACGGKHHLQPPSYHKSGFTSRLSRAPSAYGEPLIMHAAIPGMLCRNRMWHAACMGLSEAACRKHQTCCL